MDFPVIFRIDFLADGVKLFFLLVHHRFGQLDTLLFIIFFDLIISLSLLSLLFQALHVLFYLEKQIFHAFQIGIGIFQFPQRFLLAFLEFRDPRRLFK